VVAELDSCGGRCSPRQHLVAGGSPSHEDSHRGWLTSDKSVLVEVTATTAVPMRRGNAPELTGKPEIIAARTTDGRSAIPLNAEPKKSSKAFWKAKTLQGQRGFFHVEFLRKLLSPTHDEDLSRKTNPAVGRVRSEGFDDLTF